MSEKDRNEITLKVGTPKGAFTAEFRKTTKVSEVIREAIRIEQLAGSVDSFEVFFGEQQLVPIDRTLESFHLKDGDVLIVAATGRGV